MVLLAFLIMGLSFGIVCFVAKGVIQWVIER